MAKLVIVESPSKIKSVQKYLGPGYEVMASVGHIRDLPKKTLSVSTDGHFTPKYVNSPGKEEVIKKLQAAAADSDGVYLATDPDREGEAIAWHLAQILALAEDEPNRITFNAITKNAVLEGLEHPRTIDKNLVDAQQARRVLDRIVGYKLSPFLWKKVRRGLSAGRVQSVVVRLIVDREKEIRAFVPEEYWSIDAKLSQKPTSRAFMAKLNSKANGDKVEIHTADEAEAIRSALEQEAYTVVKVKKGTRNQQPSPPFITSTLQQDAARKFGMTGERTMRAAQALYEGVDIPGMGTTGLITYMRTDSVRISEEARAAGNEYIKATYGDKYLPAKPRYFKTRSGAQDGHEAIRPTMVDMTPEKAKATLTGDQFKIYKLIWERFLASLMANCVKNTQTVDIAAGEYLFRATGYAVKFDGFTVLYQESSDEEESAKALPELEEGSVLCLRELTGNQHFTQPPARYNDATLTEVMEKTGIGRPSTYAATIATVIKREYVEREKKTLKPTTLGEVTTELMCELFKDIVDTKFTASMEEDLDKVATGDMTYVETLDKFYDPFMHTIEVAEKKMEGKHAKIPDQVTDELCPNCGKNMVIKTGRFGKFLACSGYPDCKTTKPIVVRTPGKCPQCGQPMVERKSKRGFKYYGCEGYPTCKYMTWDVPTDELCPQCGKTLFKRRGGIIGCNDESCGFEKKAQRKSRKKAENSDE